MQALHNYLFNRVSASTLGYLRIVLGFFVVYDVWILHSYFKYVLSKSKYFFTYDGFHWIGMLPHYWIDVFFYATMLVGILFTLGVHYRLNAMLLFTAFLYIFLVDKGHYNNHFYLYWLLLGLFAMVQGNRWGSLDVQEERTIPYWQILIFKIQLLVVYFYGGIAKIQTDWLNGYPLRFWMEYRAEPYPSWMQGLLKSESTIYFFSWGGLVFDLVAGFMLFSDRWRRLAMPAVIFFHLTNHFIWNIGAFPWLMLAATLIFFAPDSAERLFHKNNWNRATFAAFFATLLLPNRLFKWLFSPSRAIEPQGEPYPISKKVIVFFYAWLGFQLLFPLRHFLYKGNPEWTGEGHLFAWRMMLVDIENAVKIKVSIPETGEELYVGLDQYMDWRQFDRIQRTPTSFLLFAHFIRDELKKNGVLAPKIEMQIWKSVNQRPLRLLNDTTLNYATVPYSAWQHATWIQDWTPEMDAPQLNEEAINAWKQFLKQHQESQ